MSATESTLDRDTLIAVIAWLEEAADQTNAYAEGHDPVAHHPAPGGAGRPRLNRQPPACGPCSQTAREDLATLTDRELDIAHAIGEGLSNAEIAERLYLSVPTIKAHVSAVLDKLHASNRVQVALLVHDARNS